MSRKIVFAEGCMKRSGLDEKIIKQRVMDIINRSVEYINRIDEGGIGGIVDEKHGIFIKFYVAEKAVLIDRVIGEVCLV